MKKVAVEGVSVRYLTSTRVRVLPRRPAYNGGMRKLPLGWFILSAALVIAQDWQTATTLPAVDLDGLNAVQKSRVLKLLREQDCSCGCGMKIAECRIKDPNCYYSRGLSSVMVETIRNGKSPAEALAAAKASRFATGPRQHTKLLEDPVEIPIAGAPVLGPQNAPVTLVEFSDFQCPYCVKAAAELHGVLQAYPTQVKLIFKQFPLDSHSQAAAGAAAALAAQKQGKFWALHDALFAQHGHLSPEIIGKLAADAGLDMKRFAADLNSPEVRKTVAKDEDDGERAGVEATPTLFINGQHYNGPLTLQALRPVLDGELKKVAARR